MDVLWFRSLGYGDVFWKALSLQWGIFAAFTVATFLVLYASFLALKRAHLSDLENGHTILIGGQPVKLPGRPAFINSNDRVVGGKAVSRSSAISRYN